ncbi:DUF5134 domain-containing protein [Nocardia thailandica]|uniref:DUF5134 domain-containing protein n=1 Tax=Nocardia thailandica TaxID=257275 RepID=UPI0002D35927|nr:DUF5134 domain-containing protein [Nocardia thailandica]
MTHSLPDPLRWIAIALCSTATATAILGLREDPVRRRRFGGRATEAAHAVMLTAMAVMWTPLGAELPNTFWCWLFGALTLATAVWVTAALRTGGDTAAAVYHGVAAAAMLYTTLGSTHEHHGHTMVGPVPYPAVGWALVVLFVLDAVITTGALAYQGFGRKPVRPLFTHLVMDAATAVMLFHALASR